MMKNDAIMTKEEARELVNRADSMYKQQYGKKGYKKYGKYFQGEKLGRDQTKNIYRNVRRKLFQTYFGHCKTRKANTDISNNSFLEVAITQKQGLKLLYKNLQNGELMVQTVLKIFNMRDRSNSIYMEYSRNVQIMAILDLFSLKSSIDEVFENPSLAKERIQKKKISKPEKIQIQVYTEQLNKEFNIRNDLEEFHLQEQDSLPPFHGDWKVQDSMELFVYSFPSSSSNTENSN